MKRSRYLLIIILYVFLLSFSSWAMEETDHNHDHGMQQNTHLQKEHDHGEHERHDDHGDHENHDERREDVRDEPEHALGREHQEFHDPGGAETQMLKDARHRLGNEIE